MKFTKKEIEIETKVLALAKIDKSLIDEFIINQGFSGAELFENEKNEYETKTLKAFETKVLALAKIDKSLIDKFIINQGFSETEIDNTFESTSKDINFIFKNIKETRTKSLAFELAKISKSLHGDYVKFQFGNGYIEYYLFWYLLNKPNEIKDNFTLSKVISFVNKYSDNQYNSNGHYNYLLNRCKALKAF